MQPERRRVCFVTGTRAEFGLMRSTLQAIQAHPKLRLQIIATGMHLDRSRGRSVRQIKSQWHIDRVIPWPRAASQSGNARNTGRVMASIADALHELKSDIVLVVGDRVEAFAAASAGHLAGSVVAHVHGGDRALGQVDDSLRHAITKLAHVHFPATAQSAQRIARLGENRWRIHRVGSPGLDDISTSSLRGKGERVALLVLHPADPDAGIEFKRAQAVLCEAQRLPFDRIVIIYPNNDPGSPGIIRCWKQHARRPRLQIMPDLPRPQFLELLRDATVLVGNSSAGIIEAASFGLPVIDIGPRQLGRERSQNVTNVPYNAAAIRAALLKVWNGGRPRRFRGRNIYGSGGAGRKISQILASIALDDRLRRKLIAY